MHAAAPDPLHPRLAAIFRTCLADNRQAWDLSGDGTWRQRRPAPDEPVRATHVVLLAEPVAAPEILPSVGVVEVG